MRTAKSIICRGLGFILIVGAWFLLGPAGSCLADVASPPSGFQRIELLGNSDTFVSTPYLRPTEAMGTVVSIDNNIVTVGGSPAWSAGQFVYITGAQTNSYFLLFLNGAKEGCYFGITNNGTDTLSLDLAGDTLSSVAVGDRVAIHPYWTMATLFPNGQSVHACPNPGFRYTEIFIPNFNGAGVNLSAAKTYYYFTNSSGGNWRLFPQMTNNNNDVLLPDVFFIVRHNLDIDTTLTIHGSVVCSKWSIGLATLTSGKQDNIVSLPRPAEMTLNESGLIESGAFSSSPNPGFRTDELFTFDNTVKMKNKSASATYYYYASLWRHFPSMADAGNETPFKPGNAVIIRKASGTTMPVWINLPNYQY